MFKSKKITSTNYLILLIFLSVIILDITGVSSFFGLEIIKSSSYISSKLLPILITVLSLFFAVYLLVVQLFRGHYPVNFIRKYFNENFSIDYLINIIVALVLVILDYDFVLTKYFYLVHFIYVFFIFFKSYNDYRVFEPAAKIEEFEEKIKAEIEAELNEEKISHYLQELNNYSEDSLLKNEIFLSKHILRTYKNLIIHFLMNETGQVINNEKEDSGRIYEIEKELFNKIIIQFKTAVNLDYKDYTDHILSTISHIFKITVDCERQSDYRRLSEQLKEFFSYTASQNNILAAAKIISIYSSTAVYISKEEKFNDWISEINNDLDFYSFNTSEIYSNEKLLKEMFKFYYKLLKIVFENKDQENYQEIIDKIFDFIKNTFPNINNTAVKYFKIFNGFHTNLLVKSSDYEFIKLHLKFLDKVGQLGLFYDNEDIYRYILGGFDFIIEQNRNSMEINKLVNEYKFKFVLKMLEHKDEFATIFVPDYKQLLENNSPKDDLTVDEVINGFKELLNRSLMTKNKILSYYLFEKLNDIILIYDQSDKAYQRKYLNLYKQTLYFGLYNKEPETFHLILNKFQELFFELDNSKKLSKSLCEYFIDIYYGLNISSLEEKMTEFSISINQKLNEMRKDSRLILKKQELNQKIIDSIFRIGIKGVEYGVDEVIKNSSNRLGWIGKKAIENDNSKILNLILEKAVNLINLCHEFKINERTKIFNGTLFIILGGIAEGKNKPAAAQIIRNNIYKINCASSLYSSKLIKSYESDRWDDNMGGRASDCMEKFFNSLDQKLLSAECEK